MIHDVFLTQNSSFPMREWHVEHMKKTILKFVTGLPVNANSYQKRQHKRYGRLTNICRQIEYDIVHGVTNEEVLSTLQEIRNHSSFSNLRKVDGSIERLDEMEKHFASMPLPKRKY
jgi:uncharacterized protein YlbG (UPF0298 family)